MFAHVITYLCFQNKGKCGICGDSFRWIFWVLSDHWSCTSSSLYHLYQHFIHHLYHHHLYHQRATATSSWVGGKVWKWDYCAEIHHGTDHWYRGGYYDDDSNMIMMVMGMRIVIVINVIIMVRAITLNWYFSLNLWLRYTKIQLDNWGHFDDNVNLTFFRLTSLRTTGATLSWSCARPMGKHISLHKSVSW